ncbi:methyltransferase domain-containing protein [Streptomyces lydicus]|uniref:methyltransferase domain-containing protein n=1 Tax=Streptomyces lydicus TaxID=47763 RepID=UPI003793248C
MGRWSRLVAEEFTAWLDCPAGLRYLDVGCGTGVLSAVVASRCHPRLTVGIDRSDGFVDAARSAAPPRRTSSWRTRCRFRYALKRVTWPSAIWR